MEYGEGVTPRARRILLEGISQYFEVYRDEESMQGQREEAESILLDLLHQSVLSIASINESYIFDASTICSDCKETFDLASFPPSLVIRLFVAHKEPLAKKCLNVLLHTVLAGFKSTRHLRPNLRPGGPVFVER